MDGLRVRGILRRWWIFGYAGDLSVKCVCAAGEQLQPHVHLEGYALKTVDVTRNLGHYLRERGLRNVLERQREDGVHGGFSR